MAHFTTADDAKIAIAETIEANGTDIARATEYDLDGILGETHTFDIVRQVFVRTATVAEFWASVERHAR